MKKSILAFALTAVAAFTSISAQAIETPSFYGSVGVNRSHLSVDASDFSRFDKNAYGGDIALGASFNKNFGVEFVYSDFGSRTLGIAGAGEFDAGLHAYGINGVATYAATPRLSLFVKPGIMQTHASVLGESVNKVRFSTGIGAEYAVTKQVAVTAGLQHIRDFAGTDANVTSFNTGVKFNF